MRTLSLVLATDWNVSTTTGYGIKGVLLDVYRIVPRTPTPDDPMTVEVVYKVKGMTFPDHDSADAYALESGYLKIYRG